jgi:hypothetical protein
MIASPIRRNRDRDQPADGSTARSATVARESERKSQIPFKDISGAATPATADGRGVRRAERLFLRFQIERQHRDIEERK